MDRGISTGERPTRGTTDPTERRAWLALALVPGLGSRRLAALIAQFGSATAVLEAHPRAIAATPLLSNRLARAIASTGPESADPLLHRASVQPASTSRVLFAASDSRTRFSLPRLIITSSPPSRGVAPPHRPVLPP